MDYEMIPGFYQPSARTRKLLRNYTEKILNQLEKAPEGQKVVVLRCSSYKDVIWWLWHNGHREILKKHLEFIED